MNHIRTNLDSLLVQRPKLRWEGKQAELRDLDQRIVQAHLECAEAYLTASMAARDAGEHQRALDLARLYSEQEYMARRLRDDLASRDLT